MEPAMKDRITVTLERKLIKALDAVPGASRSQKIERLLRQALALGEQRRWVAELKAFYESDAAKEEREEDAVWQRLSEEAMFRDD
jgi:metal-responsive CopG/Arc/MetJ family transcriptional regulator